MSLKIGETWQMGQSSVRKVLRLGRLGLNVVTSVILVSLLVESTVFGASRSDCECVLFNIFNLLGDLAIFVSTPDQMSL